MGNDNKISFDVRSILAKGVDPFKEIMSKVDNLKENQILEIVNSFEPIPLINVLKSKGFSAEVKREGELVITQFKKVAVSQEVSKQSVENSSENFDTVYKKFIGKLEYVDVRMLEMPEPMTTILERLESLPDDSGLLVDHKKIPQFLLPQLEERQFDIYYNEIGENHIQLLIHKRI